MFEIKVEENGQNKKFTGELTEINNEILSFKVNKEIISINFSNIKSAKILIRF